MQPFIIYFRAIAFYAAVTIPALAIPVMYMISLLYVLFYGWFACALFAAAYYVIMRSRADFSTKMALLYFSVVPAVIFAFQMLEVTGAEDNIWQSGPYLLFPFAAVVAGWISVARSHQSISDKCEAFKLTTHK